MDTIRNHLITALKKYAPTLYANIRRIFIRYEMHRRQKKATRFTHKTTKTITIFGSTFKIVLRPENGFVDRNIYTNGVYEPDILHTIKTILHRGDTYVDIGANIGQHALFAASLVGPEGTVIAFEPIPQLADQFTESVKMNDFTQRITLHQIGCSSESGRKVLQLVDGNIGGSTMHAVQGTTSQNLTIQLEPGDAFLADLPQIHLIKIDTEGHEYETLRGLTLTLAKHKPVLLLEFSPVFRIDISGYDVLEPLVQLGYTFFDLERGHQKIVHIKDWLAQFKKRQTNLLCQPPQ
jgi:FkbM family methyltransferase